MSNESLAVFRIGFGLLIAYGSVRFLAKGWVDTLYLDPDHHLTYAGLGWVSPLPAPWMHVVVAATGASGLAIALGYRYRWALACFTALFAYTEAIEASLYLNHYWFLTLMAVVLAILPAQHRWSLDVGTGRADQRLVAPRVAVIAVRAQLAVVYLFAGVAKLNGDWLMRGEPLRLWFADRADTPVVGLALAQPATALAASWAAALFDLSIVGWLLWKRTRPWAYATLVVFHLATGALFSIGLFPIVMIVSTTIFFEPDWPSGLSSRARRRLGLELRHPQPGIETPANSAPSVALSPTMLLVLGALAVGQLAVPLRHVAYPSNVRWSEEGYYLSWRVMLTDKAGLVSYDVTDPVTGERWEVGPDIVLTDWQAAHAATRPDLIHATALLIADHYRSQGRLDVEVRANAMVSMNGDPAARIIDPDIDLAAEARNLAPKPWILERP